MSLWYLPAVCRYTTGHQEVARLLIKAGAKTDFVKGVETSLHAAVRNNRVEAMKLMIEVGANIEQVDRADHTPLFNAVGEGKIEVVKLLLGAGGNVNRRDEMGATPFSEAIVRVWQAEKPYERANRVEILKLLVKTKGNASKVTLCL